MPTNDQQSSDAAKKASLDQIIATVQQLGVDPATYLEDLPPTVRGMLDQYVSGYEPGDRAGALQRIWQMVGETAKSKSVSSATQATTAAIPHAGTPTPAEQAKIDKAKTTGVADTGLTTPPWVLAEAQNNGTNITQGGSLDFQVQQRIADEWNTVFGTKYNYDQLVTLPQFRDPTDTTKKIVQASMLDVEPQVAYTVTLPGNRSYQITGDQQKTQFGAMGYDNKDVVRLVRWADTFNLKDSTGNVAWQPLASLIKAKGLNLSESIYVQDPTINSDTGKVTTPAPKAHGRGAKPTLTPFNELHPGNPLAARNEMSIAQLTNDYKQNLHQYGDPTMAYIASLDAGLASRLMASGGDTTKVSNDDSLLVQQYMLNGQWDSTTMAKLGYAGGNGLDGFLQRLKAQTTPAGGSTRMRQDPEALKQSVKDFWRTMFRSDPSEALVNQMVGELKSAEASTPKDQAFDPTAKLRSLAQADPQYKQLYGNMQPGQTEADYQGQFVNAAQDMIGNEAPDNGAVLAGMKTGQYQTTVGATAASARAWQNSKFLGRLANAAQIVSAAT